MSRPTTRVKVVHRRVADGWRAEAPDLQDFAREAQTLEAVQKLSEDGVRWVLNTDAVEIEHDVLVE